MTYDCCENAQYIFDFFHIARAFFTSVYTSRALSVNHRMTEGYTEKLQDETHLSGGETR